MHGLVGWRMKKSKSEASCSNRFQFDGVPEEVVKRLNDSKMKLMDFLVIKLEMVLEGTQLYVLAKEDILGSSKTLVGTLENEPASLTPHGTLSSTF